MRQDAIIIIQPGMSKARAWLSFGSGLTARHAKADWNRQRRRKRSVEAWGPIKRSSQGRYLAVGRNAHELARHLDQAIDQSDCSAQRIHTIASR